MTKGLMLVTAIKKQAESKSGLILPDQYEIDDIQRVIKVGPYVRTYEGDTKVMFGEGDWVKINLNRFVKPTVKQSIKDGSDFDQNTFEYYIPLVTFNGEDFLEIDQGDVEYWWDDSKEPIVDEECECRKAKRIKNNK